MNDRVTITDCRKAGFCVSGLRQHCATLGLDFRRLVKEGLPISEIEGIDDANVQRCIAVAKGEIV